MVYTYLDIETTGLSRTDDAPIQFAYLQMEDNGIFRKRAAFYINTLCKSWSADAEAVHRISREMLKEHGVEEIRALASMCAIMRSADLVTYNGNAFDIPMIKNRMQSVGIQSMYPNSSFDVMTEWQKFHGGRRRKLIDLAKELGYSEAYIAGSVKRLFGEDGIFRPHDARYDVVETMLVHRKLLEQMNAVRVQEPQPVVQQSFVSDVPKLEV